MSLNIGLHWLGNSGLFEWTVSVTGELVLGTDPASSCFGWPGDGQPDANAGVSAGNLYNNKVNLRSTKD